ncbi:SPFH domain-containing protein [Aquipuribacter sp. MA13-13]|uniref:SPFH domain-containing protein n=1 Tax=Aquipuribacter sp. MA13-13 TaxID=3440840 RepID=UPI003F493841
MDFTQVLTVIVLILVIVVAAVTVIRAVRIVQQATEVIIERLGKYQKTLGAGLHFLVPFIDRPRATVDLREQVVSFPPQPVITSDNLVVSIDTVIYFQVNDAKSATYEIANFIQGIEQLTVTTLRNVIGSLDLEQTLTSRDQINGQLRGVLDEATGKWGIRVNRVELKAIDPPASVQDSMEKQMRAERDRRATILTAEGVKQSAILTAEGEKQSAILTAEGQAQSAILKAQGESRAILQVFEAIHKGNPDDKLLAYQYLQMLPQIARGQSNKMWIIPSELTEALGGIGRAIGGRAEDTGGFMGVPTVGTGGGDDDLDVPELEDPQTALERAKAEAADASREARLAEEKTTARRARSASDTAGTPAAAPQAPTPQQTDEAPAPQSPPALPDDQQPGSSTQGPGSTAAPGGPLT